MCIISRESQEEQLNREVFHVDHIIIAIIIRREVVYVVSQKYNTHDVDVSVCEMTQSLDTAQKAAIILAQQDAYCIIH